MPLFTKSSNKTKLQSGLDQDRSRDATGCGVEEAPVESKVDGEADFFDNSKKKDVFQVDLLGVWQKP